MLENVLTSDSSNTNKLVSPLSLYLTMSMLCNGAVHDTRDSLMQVLQTGDLDLPNLNSLCKETLIQLPQEDGQVEFSLANAIWYNRRKLTLQTEYEQLMESFYYAPVLPLDFNSPKAAAQINEWVTHNTGGEINNIVDHTQATDAMMMINALYFKSAWQYPFSPNDTYQADFFALHSPAHAVAFMRRIQVTQTFSDTAFTMVELPCGQGKDYALYVLLPQNSDAGMNTWLSTIDPARLDAAIDKMTPQSIDLSLPRWETNYSLTNTNISPSIADLSNMYKIGNHKSGTSRLLHVTHIRVNEDGLVAAAASAALPTLGVERRLPNPRTILFNRPFAYFLMEKQHDLILMTGVVNDPLPPTLPPPVQPTVHHRSRITFHLPPHRQPHSSQ